MEGRYFNPDWRVQPAGLLFMVRVSRQRFGLTEREVARLRGGGGRGERERDVERERERERDLKRERDVERERGIWRERGGFGEREI